MENTIERAQDFLTVRYDDRTYRIVNVELLLRKHPADSVIRFLVKLKNEYGRKLSRLVKKNKTSPRLNEMVARRFRIKMAINTIRNGQNRN